MAKPDPQALCERLFSTFMAPLVLGGVMAPAKPFGGTNALIIGEGRAPVLEPDLLSRVQLARVRVARKLAPVDLFSPAPTAAEWAIGAMLHDLVQATHPGFDAVFRRSGPARILQVVDKTLDRVASAATVGEALSRHTWFSRMFELARTDVEVKWWTGSQTFLGSDPPKRLLAWPELRRVQQTRTPRSLMDLPSAGSAVDATKFAAVVERVLHKTPLTDLATLTRPSPAFVWSHESLALVSTNNGRRLVIRALSPLPSRAVDDALGRATRLLFAARAPRALLVAIDVLRDRALAAAALRLSGDKDPEPLLASSEPGDAAFALSAGALAATQWIARTGGGLDEATRKAMLMVLTPAASSAAAKEVRALMAG